MPQTIGQSAVTLIVLTVLLAVTLYIERRFGEVAASDIAVDAWKRWAAVGRRIGAEEPQRRPLRERMSLAPVLAVFARGDRTAEAVSLDVPDEPDPDDDTEHHVASTPAFRLRFRRGLQRTRQMLGREIRDAFAPGPTPQAFDDLEDALISADVGVDTATAICDALRDRQHDMTAAMLPDVLKDVMVSRLSQADRTLTLRPGALSVWIVVGVNGGGKTTAIAKLAARASKQGLNVCLAAADTFRAAAIEQLTTWGDRLGVDVVRQGPGADPAAVVFDAIAHADAESHDLLIVDTAGRLQSRKPLMDELAKLIRVIERSEAALTERLLVIDATTGQNGLAQAEVFGEAAGVTGVVLTKLDGTAKGGIAFAVETDLGVPIKAVGTGERARDLAPFDAEQFVDAMLSAPRA